ncbi:MULTISPECIES: sensor histidine kinase [Streptomyces]|nr:MULTISPECIES: histidine kinase [Streptomyces]
MKLREHAWPVLAGALCAVGALVEAVLRAESGRGTGLAPALLVGLGATAPLALGARRPAGALAGVASGTLLTVALYGAPAVSGLLATLAAGALAVARRARRARAAALVRDADRRASERRLRELLARDERVRIARELHDVVAHHISLISIQAETARLTTPGLPEEAAGRFLAIGDTARTALSEMRRLLGVLREDAEERDPATDRRPQPGLAQLLALVDETRRSSGARVRLLVSGRITALAPGIELAAYRIVQEALTNVRRHARGAAVDVEVRYRPEALWLRVRDSGLGTGGPGAGERATEQAAGQAGFGLSGMRERAAAAGGTVRSGPSARGGFLVEASLPLAAER